jgi:hypothetical protein
VPELERCDEDEEPEDEAPEDVDPDDEDPPWFWSDGPVAPGPVLPLLLQPIPIATHTTDESNTRSARMESSSCRRPNATDDWSRVPRARKAYSAPRVRAAYFFASAASFSRYFFVISSCSCFGTTA